MNAIIGIILSFLFAINGSFGIDNTLIIQERNTLTEVRFDGFDGYIDIYYYLIGTPSGNGLGIEVIRNNEHLVTHPMTKNDIYIERVSTSSNQLMQGNLYRYRLDVDNFMHTDLWTIRIENVSGSTISYVGSIGVYITYSVEGYGGYYQGYQEGLLQGQEDAYNQGYQQGLNDYQNSQENAQNVIDSIWGIIENATNTVLNVFSFPILPGIPLYMVLCVPLIIAVLVFIIRSLSK